DHRHLPSFPTRRSSDLAKGESAPCVRKTLDAPTYFAAMGIPVRGRVPSWTDVEQGRGDVVISASLARRFWPGEDALGKGISNARSEEHTSELQSRRDLV